MAVNLFDLLKDIFHGHDLSKKYSDQDIKNCGFSVQRIMSIKYPIQAQSQNFVGVNMINVVKYWAINMKGKYTEMPRWSMIATAKKRKEWQEKMGEMELPDKEVMTLFTNKHGLDKHELKFLIKNKRNELVEMLDVFQKELK